MIFLLLLMEDYLQFGEWIDASNIWYIAALELLIIDAPVISILIYLLRSALS